MSTIAWTVDADGDWSTAANWNPSHLPGASDDVGIDTVDLHTITFSTGTATVKTLTVGNDDFAFTGGSLTISGTAGFAHDLTVSNAAVNFGADTAVAGNFTANNAVVAGSGTLSLSGPTSFLLAQFSGPGRTIVSQNTDVQTLYLYDGRTLENAGTLNINGTVNLGSGAENSGTSGSIVNDAGATINLAPGRAILSGNQTGIVTNAGSIIAGGSPIPASIEARLLNSGNVWVNSGELDLKGGGSSSVGGIHVAAGATLGFGTNSAATIPLFKITGDGALGVAGSLIANGGSIETTGTIVFAASLTNTGTLTTDAATTFDVSTINKGMLVLEAGATFAGAVSNSGTISNEQGVAIFDTSLTNAGVLANAGSMELAGDYGSASGSLINNSGQIRFDGTTTFTTAFDGFSQITGPGSIVFAGKTILGGGTLSVDGGQLENQGTLTVSGNAGIRLGYNEFAPPMIGGGVLKNDAGATIIFDNNYVSLGVDGGGAGTSFENYGTIRLIGAGQTIFAAPFTNTGHVHVARGELELWGGGSSSVRGISVANGAALAFKSAGYVLSGGGTIGGGASSFYLWDSLSLTGKTTVFDGTFRAYGVLDLMPGNARITGLFTDLGATVSGSGILTLAGGANFNDGCMTGTGRTILLGTSSVSGFGLCLDGARTLENQGTLNITSAVHFGDTPFHVGVIGGGKLQNDAGATLILHLSSGVEALLAGAGDNSFVNLGSVEVWGHNRASVFVPFTNAGTVSVLDGGRLAVNALMTGSGTLSVGRDASFSLDASAQAGSNSVTIAANHGTVSLAGGGGNDRFSLPVAALHATDTINGGAGTGDILNFTTAGKILASEIGQVSHIEVISLASGTNKLVLTNALVASADDDHLLTVFGGSGNDTIDAGGVTSSSNSVAFTGGAGADNMTASAGADVFQYASAHDSSGGAYDTINAFNFNADMLDLSLPVSGIDAAKTTGQLDSGANFDPELAAALSSLGAHHAELFTPDSGTLQGQHFLVVDLNGVAGYQSGADLVIHLVGATGSLATGDFV